MKKLLFLLAMISSLQSCSGQSADPEQKGAATPLPKEYEACCGSESVETQFGKNKAYVYVPNAFTPTGDGVNDLFRPFIDEGVLVVRSIAIISATGDTVLFQRRDFDYKFMDANAWTGYRSNGTKYTGLFKYSISVINKERELTIITGQACCIQCGPNTAGFKTKDGCFFPAQAKSDGKLDKQADHKEKDCFK